MVSFDDKHEFLFFKDIQDREQYWIGRLVKAKVPIKKNLFDTIPTETIGLVIELIRPYEGMLHLLVIEWVTGEREACTQHDVYTYNPVPYYTRSHE